MAPGLTGTDSTAVAPAGSISGCFEQEPIVPSRGMGGRQPEGDSRSAAGSWEVSQTHLTEQVFGQKAEWIEFHVWQMRGAVARCSCVEVLLSNVQT